MKEIYFALREFWGGFENAVTGEAIPAFLEGEGVDGARSPYIVYEAADLGFGEEATLRARVYSRVVGRSGFVAPVLDVQEQFRRRLRGGAVTFPTSRGGVVMRYVGTRVLPLSMDEARSGLVCGVMEYRLKSLEAGA
ncbi:MAG: hypothetical protein FWG87_12035 [Defluviitaleaceae bacterium]|nr:hypothetical protein [Defluviitaleaceae bacterium]